MSTSASPAPSADRATVIVAHGLWMPGWVTWVLCRNLEAAGFATVQFSYRTVGTGLADNAARLAEFAAGVPGRQLHFVGHSLGGALILNTFERYPIDRGSRIVCLGSPLKGSRAAAVLEAHWWGRAIIGRCMQDLAANAGCKPWTGGCEVGIVAGDVPLGFGRLLGGLALPNDGTVAVEETRLAGATDHIVLHCTHTSLLWSPEVARQVVAFLDHGCFDRGHAARRE